MTERKGIIFDEVTTEHEPAEPVKSRGQRRGKHGFVPAVPAVRGKTVGMVATPEMLHTKQPAPNDMRPRGVDRKKIKAERKAAARNRRKRK
jgi:hypothetical protein